MQKWNNKSGLATAVQQKILNGHKTGKIPVLEKQHIFCSSGDLGTLHPNKKGPKSNIFTLILGGSGMSNFSLCYLTIPNLPLG